MGARKAHDRQSRSRPAKEEKQNTCAGIMALTSVLPLRPNGSPPEACMLSQWLNRAGLIDLADTAEPQSLSLKGTGASVGNKTLEVRHSVGWQIQAGEWQLGMQIP